MRAFSCGFCGFCYVSALSNQSWRIEDGFYALILYYFSIFFYPVNPVARNDKISNTLICSIDVYLFQRFVFYISALTFFVFWMGHLSANYYYQPRFQCCFSPLLLC